MRDMILASYSLAERYRMYTSDQLRMFTDMPFLVFVKDEELNYVWGNNSFLELIDLGSLDELVGKLAAWAAGLPAGATFTPSEGS